MRTSAGRFILIACSLLVAAVAHVALAHNGEPPPLRKGPPAKSTNDLRNVRPPPRWTWLHWWEANRDRYLVAPDQETTLQPAEAEQLAVLRTEAAGELLKSMEAAARVSLTVESALALGKMRHEPALPALLALARKGDRPEIRRAAIAGIGLLGSEAAEKALIELKPTRPDDAVATLVALGLHPKLSPDTLRQLRARITADLANDDAKKVGTSSVIAWALRGHGREDNLAYFRGLLKTSISPWVASESVLGLGGTKDHAAQRMLEDLLFGTITGEVFAYDNLDALVRNQNIQNVDPGKPGRLGPDGIIRGSRPVSPSRPGRGVGNAPERDEATGRRLEDMEEEGVRVSRPEYVAMGWLQSSAAVALGEIDAPRAGESLLRFLDEDEDRYPHLETPMEFAIMSLASYPTEATRDRLINLVGKDDQAGKTKLDGKKDSPLRGFAALSLGLYARPEKTEQGAADRPRHDWAITTLAERLDDDREEEEVRTACAVALGLTQRSAVLPMLQKTGNRLEQRGRRGDQAVLGFILLGRALAGDKALIEPASKFVVGRPDDVTPSGILSRRAAVLALGVTRSSNAIPVLTKAWHLNHYVNREVILALRLVGGSNAATPVMERLREAKDLEERAYMAQALGELLAVERPTALVRLTAGSNYTVRNEHLLPFQSIANGFLFDYLIASAGEQQ
jgi:HEAT repeat protein